MWRRALNWLTGARTQIRDLTRRAEHAEDRSEYYAREALRHLLRGRHLLPEPSRVQYNAVQARWDEVEMMDVEDVFDLVNEPLFDDVALNVVRPRWKAWLTDDTVSVTVRYAALSVLDEMGLLVAAVTACPACGFAPSADAVYCGGCGTALHAEAR